MRGPFAIWSPMLQVDGRYKIIMVITIETLCKVENKPLPRCLGSAMILSSISLPDGRAILPTVTRLTLLMYLVDFIVECLRTTLQIERQRSIVTCLPSPTLNAMSMSLYQIISELIYRFWP